MTNRTASLLLLFVSALAAAGVLLAMTVALLEGTSIAGPWLVPAIAVVCQVVALQLGRHYILPPVAQAPWRAASTIGVLVTLTLAASLAVVWLLQWVSRRLFAVPLIAIVLWFFFLWLAFCQRNWHSPIKSSPPS